MKHVVFVDSTATGILAFESAKKLGCYVSFVKPLDSSFVDIANKGKAGTQNQYLNVDYFATIDDLQQKSLRPVLEALNAKQPIDAIITTSEAAVTAVAREAEHFGTIYPKYETLCDTVFKHRCRDVLSKAGVRSTGFEVLTELELLEGAKPQKVELPFVIKPTRGFGKEFSAICTTEEQFNRFVDQLTAAREASNPMVELLISHEYIVEQYIGGTLYSVEVLVQNGQTHCMATNLRVRSQTNEMVEMTSTMPCELTGAAKTELTDYVAQVMSALNIDVGVYHVEVICDDKGPCLIEVNGRLIGAVVPLLYKMLSKLDMFDLMVRLHLGQPVEVDDSCLEGAGTLIAVGAVRGGTVAQQFNSACFDALLEKYSVQYTSLKLAPGTHFGQHGSNLSSMGHVILLATDPIEAVAQGRRFLCELESMVGFELGKFVVP
jgi:biotin carboxylase